MYYDAYYSVEADGRRIDARANRKCVRAWGNYKFDIPDGGDRFHGTPFAFTYDNNCFCLWCGRESSSKLSLFNDAEQQHHEDCAVLKWSREIDKANDPLNHTES